MLMLFYEASSDLSRDNISRCTTAWIKQHSDRQGNGQTAHALPKQST